MVATVVTSLLLLVLAGAAGQLSVEDQMRVEKLLEASKDQMVAIVPPKGDIVVLPPPFRQPPGGCARNKTLHLIRHAEGTHNAAEEEAKELKLHTKSKRHTELQKQHGDAWVLLEEVSGNDYWDAPLS